MRFTRNSLTYACERLLNVPAWRPSIDPEDVDGALDVLARCDSYLEAMYALGAVFRLEFRSMRHMTVMPSMTSVLDRTWLGLWVHSPWDGFRCDHCGGSSGPSGLVLIPQIILVGRAWDFGIVITDDNGSAAPGHVFGVLEVDGYAVHRPRRMIDRRTRQALAARGARVFTCYEEQHDPLRWIDAVIHEFWYASEPDARRCSAGSRAAEVFVPISRNAA